MPNMNFGYSGNNDANDASATNDVTPRSISDLDNGNTLVAPPDGEEADDITVKHDEDKSGDSNTNKGGDTSAKNKTDDDNADGDNGNGAEDLPHDLEPGTELEVGDSTYTIDDNGNVIDKDGKIYKEAKDIKAWIAEFETSDDNPDEISIATLQKEFDVEVTDEDGKLIEFDNSPAGIKSYVEAIIDAQKDEIQEATINTLYSKYPILQQVLPYVAANGGSLEGFSDIKDRTGISIDDSNEAQQESIIREAWAEEDRRGDVDNYIAYLKSNGLLLDTAKEELKGLQEKDIALREELEKEAEEREELAIKQQTEYWSSIKETIDGRNIAGYKIPDTIIIERDGKKISATPDDFFNYLYQVDSNGKSRYDYDLENTDPESRRNDAVLRAYLKFVGGNYTNLVDMAVNDKEVKKLKLTAKNRRDATIKVNKPNNKKDITKTNFGY